MEDKISKLGKKIKIEKIKASSGKADIIDIIPFELLLTISLNGSAISTISCSPANLIELTVGYLVNNGYIKDYSDLILYTTLNHNQICRKLQMFPSFLHHDNGLSFQLFQ